MLLDSLFLIGGLVLILVGANLLTDGASALAKRWGISDLVVGLTVVAFGTSAPELVISVIAAINGSAGMAIGSAVGSNIFNIFVILGVTALVRPIKVDDGLLTKDIPLVLLSALALWAMGNGPLLDGDASATLSRVDGIVLLLFFLIFLRYTFSQASDPTVPNGEVEDQGAQIKTMSLGKSAVWIVVGLAGLIVGGDWFVDGASDVASAMGVSDAVIGLTVVAAGTSLPELATSIAAALKGKHGIAIGNVIGSSIFNSFFVLGCAATIRELPFGEIGNFDLITMTVGCVLFWLFGRYFKNRTITRFEGAILSAAYIAYIALLVAKA